jgi:sodium/pantothenate symporter
MAVAVHFGAYYGGWSWYLQGSVRNPAVAATYAILASLAVGVLVYYLRDHRAKA